MSNKLVKSNVHGNDIIIDDGEEIYNIKNKRGKTLGKFVFRPSDTNIIDRYKEVAKFYESYQMPEKTGDLEKDVENIRKAENDIAEKISYLIGADAKEAFFGILGPFAALKSGELFVENVLSSISTVIEREMNVRTQKVKKRMNKYVAKYHN
jgi:hypothetical protein